MKHFISKPEIKNKININKRVLYNFLISTTGFWVVLILWIIMSGYFNPLILPSPDRVFSALLQLIKSGQLLHNLLISLRRTVVGYASAVVIGFIMALLTARSKLLRYILRPMITVIQSTPPIIWLVLAVIWFGIAEDLTPIFLIFVVTFPVIFINILAGIQDIDKELVDLARVYQIKQRKIFLEIYLPALIPHLISALSIGFAFAWKSTVFAEYLGSSSGVGFALSVANSNLETAELFAWAIILITLMLIVEYLILQPIQRNVTGWREYEKSS